MMELTTQWWNLQRTMGLTTPFSFFLCMWASIRSGAGEFISSVRQSLVNHLYGTIVILRLLSSHDSDVVNAVQ